ncbi:Scavenger receptor class B member 1 [Nymphon striatum]|nr:Scavenger receptor class B member 1 [Nymphon striatum]
MEKCFLGCIGQLMAGTGLAQVLEVTYAENTVKHMLTGKAIYIAVRGHFMVLVNWPENKILRTLGKKDINIEDHTTELCAAYVLKCSDNIKCLRVAADQISKDANNINLLSPKCGEKRTRKKNTKYYEDTDSDEYPQFTVHQKKKKTNKIHDEDLASQIEKELSQSLLEETKNANTHAEDAVFDNSQLSVLEHSKNKESREQLRRQIRRLKEENSRLQLTNKNLHQLIENQKNLPDLLALLNSYVNKERNIEPPSPSEMTSSTVKEPEELLVCFIMKETMENEKTVKYLTELKIMQKYKKISISLWVIGCLLVLVGAIIILVFPVIFHQMIKKNMVLSDNSKSYDQWQTIQLPVYQKFYFFNVTNPEDIENNGATPILKEIGPYIYREQLIKENITWNANETVSYLERHVYTYQQNMTNLHEDDVIVSINAPLLTLAKTVENKDFWIKFIADLALVTLLKNEKLFVKHTVKELAFDGYHDILVALSSLVEKHPPVYGNRFGWFYPKNNSNDGLYTVRTGKKDFSKYLWVEKWQHQSVVKSLLKKAKSENKDPYFAILTYRDTPFLDDKSPAHSLNYWSGEYCNAIKGPVPELFKPLNHEKKLDMFVTDLCRSVQLEYKEDVMVHEVIKSRHYVMPNSTLEKSPQNKCFCNGKCFPTGVMNISKCHGGAPLALSWPHFYMGDPQLVKDVKGLKPNKTKHEFYWDIEPITGLTTQFSARIQINIPLKKHPYIEKLKNVPNVLFPVFWVSKDGIMTDLLANNLLDVTVKPKKEANISCSCVIAVGLLIVIITVVVFLIIRRKEKKDESLLSNDEYATKDDY